MLILVTGGAGFIVSHIVTALLGAGHELRVLDALLPAAHRTTPAIPDGVDWRHADVRDMNAVVDALQGADAVCHQAAMVGRGKDFADASDYVGCNDLGTAVLLAGMADTGVRRLVLASSMVVHGEGRYECSRHGVVRPGPRLTGDLEAGLFEPSCPHCGEPLAAGLVGEDAPTDPRNVYAATKLAQERLAAWWARATGGRVAALRYHNVYGPGMPRDTPYAGVASLFRSALARGEAPHVFEDGAQRRDFVHPRCGRREPGGAGRRRRSSRRRLEAVQRRQRGAAHRGGDGGGTGPRVRRPDSGGDGRVPARGRSAHHRLLSASA